MLLVRLCLCCCGRFIRKVLDEAGGQAVKIISKIESWHGVTNFDDILAVTGQHTWRAT
jgi:2-keto-3-deoxy-L-rhamnonate aldolase RhmA